MPYPRKPSLEAIRRMEEVMRARMAVPSNQDVATELNLSPVVVNRWMSKIRLTLVAISKAFHVEQKRDES